METNYRNVVRAHNALAAPYPLPDGVVDTCITSPPYWGKRDYQHPDQIGMEPTPEEFVDHMVTVFREVRRVLKPTGTLWLNLGDTYWAGKGASAQAWSKENGRHLHRDAQSWAGKGQTRPQDRRHPVIKPKDLVGIPWMVAFALRADGWRLRGEIIWDKPNAMPESVKDRPTVAHETLFLLTKQAHYYYDHVAIQEEVTPDRRDTRLKPSTKYEGLSLVPDDKAQTSHQQGMERWQFNEQGVAVRNKRSVWRVPTVGYPGDHFAVFPEELIIPCLKAGTSEKGNCAACGAPWERVTEPVIDVANDGASSTDYPEGTTANSLAKKRQAAREQGVEYTGARRTVGWRPTCACQDAGLVRPLIFDPFGGAGTTAVVAQAHGRDYYLQELNPTYVTDIQERLRHEFGMFHHQNHTSK